MSADDRDLSAALMERVGRGDEDALAELYGRWARPLLNFLYRMCRDRALAEDLLQDVFLKVWRAAPRYRPLAKFSTWLFQIARNHWLNEREKIMRRVRPVSLDRTGPVGDDGVRLKELVPGDDAPPDEKALDSELGARIDDAAAALPEKLRAVWVLGAAQGLPYAQVAEILEIPVGTVKSRMFQAVRQLRAQLLPYVEGT
jgi:RNA polymerase sigma-70 factor (ECF subfamily)